LEEADMSNGSPASQDPAPQRSPTPGWKKALATVLTMVIALVVGVPLVGFLYKDRIYLGRPLGRTVIRLQSGTDYRRLGTGTYELRRTVHNHPDDRINRYDVTADIAYRAALPETWEDMTWAERLKRVAEKLPHEKWPSKNRICWSGDGLPSAEQAAWIALPYHQSYYNTQGHADRNYRGYLLLFERNVGGFLMLDVFKRRQGRDRTAAGLDGNDRSDWARVKDYILEMNTRIRPQLITDQAKLVDLKLPARNPLCLGSYQLGLPRNTKFQTRKSGFYHLADEGVEAYVGYRQNINVPLATDEDMYKLLRANCPSTLHPKGEAVRLAGNRGSWQRYQRVACDGRAQGILATIPIDDQGTITFDVYTKQADGSAWKRVREYLVGLQQGMGRCDAPRQAPPASSAPAASADGRPAMQMPSSICSPVPAWPPPPF